MTITELKNEIAKKRAEIRKINGEIRGLEKELEAGRMKRKDYRERKAKRDRAAWNNYREAGRDMEFTRG